LVEEEVKIWKDEIRRDRNCCYFLSISQRRVSSFVFSTVKLKQLTPKKQPGFVIGKKHHHYFHQFPQLGILSVVLDKVVK